LSRCFGIDLRTAIYATAPGGLSGMALTAADAGADSAVSMLFQLFRLVLILVATPILAALALR
ncbi:MAG TPA: AbrB family transcriptional regulator, partial [Rectinemataceae bacterium]|nr:AbrB family transcriptional regulator [Rectinemataceae bacterium]